MVDVRIAFFYNRPTSTTVPIASLQVQYGYEYAFSTVEVRCETQNVLFDAPLFTFFTVNSSHTMNNYCIICCAPLKYIRTQYFMKNLDRFGEGGSSIYF